MRNLKASEIIEAMEIFSEKCKKLDNMRDELLNMFVSLLQRIKEEENTQNIEKKEYSEQDEEQEERVFMHVEAEKLMCPFGGDCIAYLCPFDGDCIAYQSLTLLIGKSFAEQEQQKDVGSVGRCTFDE